MHYTQAVCNANEAKQVEEQQKKQEEEEGKLLKEIEALQLRRANTKSERDNKEKRENKEKRDTNNNGYNGQVTQNTAHNSPPRYWHKDFKIAGQIGEPGQKDKLNFFKFSTAN